VPKDKRIVYDEETADVSSKDIFRSNYFVQKVHWGEVNIPMKPESF